MSSENAFIGIMFDSDKMRIFTVMGRTTIPNKHHAMMLMWALLLLQVGHFLGNLFICYTEIFEL